LYQRAEQKKEDPKERDGNEIVPKAEISKRDDDPKGRYQNKMPTRGFLKTKMAHQGTSMR
jgi:hypothetical protein